MSVSTALNYANPYWDIASIQKRRVGTSVSVDSQLRLLFASGGLLTGTNTELVLDIENLFNTQPPFLNNQLGVGYDQENADLTGRVFRLTVIRRW